MKISEKIFKFTLLALIFATLIFIFVQSMLPREVSSAESEAVGGIIEEIFPSDTPTGAYVQKNIRKIAHFTEFGVLGVEVALYVAFFAKRKIFIALSYPAALITAFFDESIQIFSKRGPLITDVWVDFLGFFVFATLTYAVFFTASYLIMRYNKGKNSNGKNNRS